MLMVPITNPISELTSNILLEAIRVKQKSKPRVVIVMSKESVHVYLTKKDTESSEVFMCYTCSCVFHTEEAGLYYLRCVLSNCQCMMVNIAKYEYVTLNLTSRHLIAPSIFKDN